MVERLGRGEEVDVATEAPPLEFGDDEIGQVGQAFNAVQDTAVRTAVEEAELRRGIREIFLNLARRTQALVHRQLTLLDEMERREHDAEELEDLFRVDHLATRMRRNAENLIVLAGATPGRGWRRNVPMIDVVRGAVAEVEDYTRVDVQPMGAVPLAGRAVGDVIHLLAELIENGLSFSPPHTRSRCAASWSPTGTRGDRGPRPRHERGGPGRAPTSASWTSPSSTWPTPPASACSWWAGSPGGTASGSSSSSRRTAARPPSC